MTGRQRFFPGLPSHHPHGQAENVGENKNRILLPLPQLLTDEQKSVRVCSLKNPVTCDQVNFFVAW
jgi:hypothetical protein